MADMFPSDHIPTQREAARPKFADFLEHQAAAR